MVSAALSAFETTHFPLMLVRSKEILLAPFAGGEILWIVVPLIFTLLVMETYFGRYARDELGWNTAVGNALVLLFVAMDLFRTLVRQLPEPHTFRAVLLHLPEGRFILAACVGIGGCYLIATNFFRILPKEIAFEISSAYPINFIAYATIVLVYTEIPLDWYTLFGAVVLFCLLAMFFWFFRLLIPYATPAESKR